MLERVIRKYNFIVFKSITGAAKKYITAKTQILDKWQGNFYQEVAGLEPGTSCLGRRLDPSATQNIGRDNFAISNIFNNLIFNSKNLYISIGLPATHFSVYSTRLDSSGNLCTPDVGYRMSKS